LRRIQKRNSERRTVSQDKRQFRPAQDQPLNTLLLLHARRDRAQPFAVIRQKFSRNELIYVFVMNVILFLRRRDSEPNAFARKHIRVKPALHGKPSSK